MSKLKLFAASAACAMGIALTACGGGGGSGGGSSPQPDTPPAPTPIVPTTPTAPGITTPPANQSVVAGQTAAFSVVATGSATLAYQWKKNGGNIDGATNSTYTTPATSLGDSGAVFTVVVSNSAGTVTSNTATLTVSAAPEAPAIAPQPSAQTVTVGASATFSVAATGTSPLRYQWKKAGTNIPEATSSSYTTPVTSLADSGTKYSVVVSNDLGTVTSNEVSLTVTSVPVITTQPTAQLVARGQTASFSVVATGNPSLGYQWKRDGIDIPGATSSTYTKQVASGDNGAVFTVVVSNSLGTVTSNEAVLSDVAIATQPAAQSVVAPATASFSVTAGGTGPFTYQWQKNGSDIDGETASTYTTPATAIGDSGALYSVVVSNSAGTVTSSTATLTVFTEKYSLVPKTGGGTYTKEECVKDNITGLVWEGKTASPATSRLGTTTYTNYDGTGVGQKSDGSNADPDTEINVPGNSIGYRDSVRLLNLCGYNDWRMPTSEELEGIFVGGASPTINTGWFLNMPAANGYIYWSSSDAGNLYQTKFARFLDGGTAFNNRSVLFHVRLVR